MYLGISLGREDVTRSFSSLVHCKSYSTRAWLSSIFPFPLAVGKRRLSFKVALYYGLLLYVLLLYSLFKRTPSSRPPLGAYLVTSCTVYASGSLNLTILQHIALAELCLLELVTKVETMICHILATCMAVYYITTKPNYMKSDTLIYIQQR